MTIIAANSQMIACDTQVTSGSVKEDFGSKIVRVEQSRGFPEMLIGSSGDMHVQRWARGLKNTEAGDLSSVEALWSSFVDDEKARGQRDNGNDSRNEALVLLGGTVYECACTGVVLIPHSGYAAAGSGAAVALGAMWAGADPDEAVCAAMDHDLYCGGRLIVERP